MGIFIGFLWFLIVLKGILNTNNSFRNLFKRFGVINTITDDHINDNNYNCNTKIEKQFEALSQKQKTISDLNNKIKMFKENMQNMEFIKNIDEKDSQNNNFKKKIEDSIENQINKIINNDNLKNLSENDIELLDQYIGQINKKNK